MKRALLPALALPLTGLVLYGSSGRDDTYITYWAAKALAETGEIQNYNGQLVEQSSSLLHVLCLALLDLVLPLDLPLMGYWFAMLAGMAAILAMGVLGSSMGRGGAAAASLMAATAPYLVYWSVSGMETPLAALTACLFLIAAHSLLSGGLGARQLTVVFGAALLHILARPESFAVLLATLLGLLLIVLASPRGGAGRPGPAGRPSAGSVLVLFTGVLLLSVSVAAGRYLYFGALFPQPVTAKAGSLSLDRLGAGLAYLLTHGAGSWGAALMILGATGAVIALYRVLVAGEAPGIEALSALYLVSGIGFVVLSGGDWMEAGRFLVPFLPAAVVLTVSLIRIWPGSRRMIPAAALLAVLNLAGAIGVAATSSTGTPLWAVEWSRPRGLVPFSWMDVVNRVHLRDTLLIEALDGTVREALKRRPEGLTILSSHMGMPAYFIASRYGNRVTWLDRYGLSTRHFTDCPVSAEQGSNAAGVVLIYLFLLTHQGEIESRCGVPHADIIYDQRPWWTSDLFPRHGYTMVYGQGGFVRSGSRLLPGQSLPADMFIAARNGLLPGASFRLRRFPSGSGER